MLSGTSTPKGTVSQPGAPFINCQVGSVEHIGDPDHGCGSTCTCNGPDAHDGALVTLHCPQSHAFVQSGPCTISVSACVKPVGHTAERVGANATRVQPAGTTTQAWPLHVVAIASPALPASRVPAAPSGTVSLLPLLEISVPDASGPVPLTSTEHARSEARLAKDTRRGRGGRSNVGPCATASGALRRSTAARP